MQTEYVSSEWFSLRKKASVLISESPWHWTHPEPVSEGTRQLTNCSMPVHWKPVRSGRR